MQNILVYEVQHSDLGQGENGKPFGALDGALNQKFLAFF